MHRVAFEVPLLVWVSTFIVSGDSLPTGAFQLPMPGSAVKTMRSSSGLCMCGRQPAVLWQLHSSPLCAPLALQGRLLHSPDSPWSPCSPGASPAIISQRDPECRVVQSTSCSMWSSRRGPPAFPQTCSRRCSRAWTAGVRPAALCLLRCCQPASCCGLCTRSMHCCEAARCAVLDVLLQVRPLIAAPAPGPATRASGPPAARWLQPA